jgi:hypothetical protein
MLVRCYVNSGDTGHFKSSPTRFLTVRREKRVRIAFARLKIKQKDSSARAVTLPGELLNMTEIQCLAF